ncbi:hypothetical protein TELCIR_20421 [Teladorsagia circumcincta]|uniref:Solute carrier family 3 member 2 N-terminal domain-containing protein n=1 Tax=Teladorsagia circumcincta TaxID=45464 RepID=A0A2G9TLC1_TELCI|nr:hypothetical protein TELCIR_20421 [Teladorsagia circumcincta]
MKRYSVTFLFYGAHRTTKSGSDDTHEKLVIGLTAKQLEIARQTKFWKTWRIAALVLFWLLWAGMVTGAVLIIVLKNGDVPKTTTVIITETTTHK